MTSHGSHARPLAVDIAVIGAGASGLLCIAHLGRVAQREGYQLTVALIDPSPPHSAGIAYSTTHVEHLMNVRACRLSAFVDEPDHFVDWATAHGTAVHPDGFAPRAVYGRYLRSVANAAADVVTVHRIHQRCTAIDSSPRSPGTASLQLEDGQSIDADHVVLALGNAQPVPLAGCADNVIDDPWDDDRIGLIGPHDDVVIVGTGLTAVDTLLMLDTQGHRGSTTIVSRHGRWPAAHIAAPRTCVIPSARTMDFSSARPITARSIVATLRDALARRGEEDWQTIVDQVRPHTVRLWQSLDEAERDRFVRLARPMWEAHRHRMAPDIAIRLAKILASGRAITIAGRIGEITPNHTRASVAVDGAHGRFTIGTRWVINCTGPAVDIRRRNDPLIRSLLADGHVRPGWRGWGLDVDTCGRLRHCSELGRNTFSAIGPLRLGADYETTAIPEIRCQAAVVAQRLLDRPVRSNVA